MPAGDTSDGVSEVMAPMTPTVSPPTSKMAYSGRMGVPVLS